jgi:hypothetical protein
VRELVPGIHHWTARHPRIKIRVSSYYLEPAGVLLDPILPEDVALDWFAERDPAPQQIVLTNRHHYRHSDEFREALGGIPVRASSPGMHEFEDGPQVDPFEFGDELAPGVRAIEIGGICPDDTALHIDLAGGTIAFADGLVRPPGGGPLSFVPDGLMGEPERDKQALRDSLRGLLERDFENLLFAHGDPLVGGGKQALREFLD